MKLIQRDSQPQEITRFRDIGVGEVFQASYSDCGPEIYMVICTDSERLTVHLASGGTLRQFRPDHPVVRIDAELHWGLK